MSETDFIVRQPTPADADAIGSVIFRAFASIAARHSFTRDFASAEVGTHLARALVDHPGYWGVVAEVGGKVVASNFLDQRDEIGGVGPMTVLPEFQGMGIGRRLMQAVVDRGR